MRRLTVLLTTFAMFLGVFAGVVAPVQAAGSSVGSFEIDGNLVDDSGPGEPIDWETPPPNLTSFTDATGAGDDSFNTGSKELEPGGWECLTASAPSKDDILSGDIAFRVFDGQQFVYVDYTRLGVNGDAHIDYEFNQSSEPNPVCPDVPIRTTGDIVITFDTEQGGKQIFVRAFRWVGSATIGNFVQIDTGQQGVTYDGAVNIPNTIPNHTAGDYGEAALNLTQTIGTIECGQFATAYMKTRASTSISASLKDRTRPAAVDVGTCPQSSLDKAVRNVTQGGTFANQADANPGDTIEYQLTYTNSGEATAHNVVINDTLDAHQTFLSCSDNCAVNGSTLTWTIGDVGPGQTVVVTFQVQLDAEFPPGATTISNVGVVTTQEEGDTPSDETTVTVFVPPFVDLNLEKAADGTVFGPGDTITYTLSYRNDGNIDATNVVIHDTLPPGTEFVSCSDNCTVSGNDVSWSIGTVAPGGSGSVTLTVRVLNTADCQICNIATVSSPDEGNGTPVQSNELCVNAAPGGDPAGAHASGHAWALRATVPLLTLDLIEPRDVTSSQSGSGSASDSAEALKLAIPPPTGEVVTARVLNGDTSSNIDSSGASQVSIGEVANVNILNGTITASAVRGVAQADADGGSSSFSSLGTALADVVVNGVARDVVAPNTRIDLPILGGAYVILYEEDGTTSRPPAGVRSGGTYSSSVTVNAIHVHINDGDPLTDGDQATDITVGHATAAADFPQTTQCPLVAQTAVSGSALIASLRSAVPVPVTVGAVSIPATGGHAHQAIDELFLPNDGSAATAAASQTDTSGGGTTAGSSANVADVCVKSPDGCMVSAKVVHSEASTAGTTSSGSSQLVNLVVGGMPITVDQPPNTVIDLGVALVIINEQTCDNGADLAAGCDDGAGHSGITVRALHVILLPGDAPLVDLVVAESHSDATP